jgi:hypothetical protein
MILLLKKIENLENKYLTFSEIQKNHPSRIPQEKTDI